MTSFVCRLQSLCQSKTQTTKPWLMGFVGKTSTLKRKHRLCCTNKLSYSFDSGELKEKKMEFICVLEIVNVFIMNNYR